MAAQNERAVTRAAHQSRVVRSSLPKFVTHGAHIPFHDDLYPFILKLSWTRFFALLASAFIILNLVFAGLYMIVPGSVANANGFLDHFFFSIETMATIGYGEMTPAGTFAHTVMSVEALGGIVATAMMTGLIFARFARPTSQVLFSDKMVIAPWNGKPHLMFRMANQRQNQIAEATVSVVLLIVENTIEGETIRRPIPLKLVRDKNLMFALTWMAMHEIDESSLFYGEGAWQKLVDMKAEIFVSLTGLDETLMQTIIARWRYQLDHIERDARFIDVISVRDDGTRVLDYDKFHQTAPVERNEKKK
jgi:inward rectifier potassium channel